MKLTAVSAKTLPARGRRRAEYPDDVVPGLWLIVTPAGARSWVVRYSFAGRDRRFTIGKLRRITLEKARAKAKEVLALVDLGQDPQAEKVAKRRAAPPPAPTSIAALGKEALARLQLRPATRREFERLYRVEIVPAFGRLYADQLTRREIRAWTEKLAKRAPYVANRAFDVLRRFYSFGVERDMLQATPFVGLKHAGHQEASERVLSAAELWALQRALEELPTTGSDVVQLLLLTGVRRGMVLGARRGEFEDLDGADPRWIIPGGFEGRSKSKRAHVVPLSKPAVELVKARLHAIAGADELFPAGEARPGRKAASTSKVWRSSYVKYLCKRVDARLGAPVPRWTIHNLRQTIGTHLREDLGVRADVVSLILGHAVTEGARVTRIYDRAQLLRERRAALTSWASWLEQLPEPGKLLPFRAASAGDGRETD